MHATPGVRLEEVPPLRRGNRRWHWRQVTAWSLVGAAGLAAAPQVPVLFCVGLAALGQLAPLLRQPRWVQVDSRGVQLAYPWGGTFLPWSCIKAVEGMTLQTSRGRFALPPALHEGGVLMRVIAGVVRGETLLPPAARPRPPLTVLQEWFGRPVQAGLVRLRMGLWSARERFVCTAGLTLSIFWGLLFALTGMPGLLWTGCAILVATLVLWVAAPLTRWRYPYAIGLDPQGVELAYLLRRRRFTWDELTGLSDNRLSTLYGAVPLDLDDALQQRLSSWIDSLAGARTGVVMPPPDGARRALSPVSGPDAPRAGGELAESRPGSAGSAGRALEEALPG